MSDWSDGYITNTEYTAHFYPFLAPSAQNLALLLAGVKTVDLSQGFTYCELGCGHGFSTALLAAANPDGQFYGVDFNPAHIASANQLKAAAQIGNAQFLEKSFAELAQADLPAFDFIALHGVWSWISHENRAAITAFIYAKLKPGGVVYVSYNAMPGWAGVAPLRQLFIESQRHKTETDAASVDAAMDLANRLKALDAGFFKMNPIAGANLDGMAKLSKNYILHEYFNQAWEPSYFSDVASAMKAAKLGFACSSDIVEHIDQLCLSPDALALLKTLPDATARETIRDYFRNSRFRRDIFTRGARKLGADERAGLLRGLRLAKTGAPEFPFQAKFPVGAVTLAADPHQAIMEHLSAGPATLGSLSENPALARHGPQGIFQAVLLLLATGRLQPALAAGGEEARRESTKRFNRAVMMQPLGAEAQMLASPALGNGLAFPRIDQFFMAAGENASTEEIIRIMKARKITLLQSGEAAPDNHAAVKQAHEGFKNERLPIYRALGVV